MTNNNLRKIKMQIIELGQSNPVVADTLRNMSAKYNISLTALLNTKLEELQYEIIKNITSKK